MIGQVDKEWAKEWMKQGKGRVWDVNPPKASHFGGVWERVIGSVRKVIDAMLMPLQNRLVSKEEFDTILAEAMKVVNSTPLWSALDSPNEPHPLNPGMLLTQKENPYPLPQDEYNERNILEYGPTRWKRIQTLARGFWDEWRTGYMYEIGKHRSKWVSAKRNAKIGDVVLIKEKLRHN